MAKNDKSKVNQASIQERNTVNQQYGDFMNTVNQNMKEQTPFANEQNRFATQGYQDIYNRGGIDPTVAANLRSYNRPYSSVYAPKPEGSSGGGGESSGGGGGGSYGPPPDAFGSSRSAFQNFINSGGVDIGAMKEALGGYRNLSETGGYSPEQRKFLESAATRASQIGETGGFAPETLTRLRKDISGIRDIGELGGIDPAELSNLRGDISGMRNFAAMGGLTPEEVSTMRTQSVLPIQSLGRNQQAQIEQMSRINPGIAGAASIASASRQNAQALGNQALSTEAELARQMSANRIRGLESASTAGRVLEGSLADRRLSALGSAAGLEGNIENSLIANKLAGTQLGAGITSDMANAIAANQLSALGGITQTQQGAESIAQQGKIAGAQGMFGIEQADLQAALAREAQAAAERAASEQAAAYSDAQRAADERFWAEFGAGNEQFIGGTGLQGQLGALGGIGQLYGTTPGTQGLNYEAMLGALGGRAGGAQGALNTQLQSSGPSGWDRFTQIAGMAVPIAGAFLGTPTMGGGSSRSYSYAPSTPNLTNQYIPGAGIPGWNYYRR